MSTSHSAVEAMKGGGFAIDVSTKEVEVIVTVTTIITPE
jgi:hypothetical protein